MDIATSISDNARALRAAQQARAIAEARGDALAAGEAIHRLALSQMTRSLNDVDDNDVVSKIAQEHGLSGEGPKGTKTQVLQGNVTDAVFLKRIAAKHGTDRLARSLHGRSWPI